MKKDFQDAICYVTVDDTKPPPPPSFGRASHAPGELVPSRARSPAFRLVVAHHPDHYMLFDRKTRRFKWVGEISEEELRLVASDSDGSDD
jgi:hypothetical protein